MATSDVVLPLEILEELVVRDLSPASLAVWCRVGSRALLTFAGRHLYEEVTLTRGDDVVPFLRRLCLPLDPTEPAPLMPMRLLEKLIILDMPAEEDLDSFWNEWEGYVPVGVYSLHLRWPDTAPAEDEAGEADQDALDLFGGFFAPFFLILLDPTEYGEISPLEAGGPGESDEASVKLFPLTILGDYLEILDRVGLSDDVKTVSRAHHACSSLAEMERTVPAQLNELASKFAATVALLEADGHRPRDACPGFDQLEARFEDRYAPYQPFEDIAACSLVRFTTHLHVLIRNASRQLLGRSRACVKLTEFGKVCAEERTAGLRAENARLREQLSLLSL